MEAPSKKAAREELRSGKSNLLYLPIHVMTEILCRLPIKTLAAVKCVCKSWLNLVSDDTDLPKLHRQRSPATTELLLRPAAYSRTLYIGNAQFHNDSVDDVKLSLLFDLPGFCVTSNDTIIVLGKIKRSQLKIIRSEEIKIQMNYPIFANLCNGLVCFQSISDSKFDSRGAVITNPVTGEFITVNYPLSTKWGEEIVPAVNYRLGFSEKENRFKLLRATCRARANSSEQFAEIFTFEKGSKWRDVGDCPYPILQNARSVTLEHTLHYDFVCSGTMHNGIACFDFEKERFGVVPVPRCKAPNRKSLFGVFRGCLFISWLPHIGDGNEIWVMKEYGVGDSWEKIFSIPSRCSVPLKQLENGVEDSCGKEMVYAHYGCHVPLKQLENGEILMLSKHKCLVLHNPSQNTTRIIRYGVEFSEASAYSPTLLRLEDALAGYEACIHNVNSRRRNLTPGHPEDEHTLKKLNKRTLTPGHPEGENTLKKLNKRTLTPSHPEGQNTLKKLNKRAKKRRLKS